MGTLLPPDPILSRFKSVLVLHALSTLIPPPLPPMSTTTSRWVRVVHLATIQSSPCAQADINDYVAACLAVDAPVPRPTLKAPTNDKSSGAGSGTNSATTPNAATTIPRDTDTLTRAATIGTSASHSAPASASASSTGAAVNLKAPIGLGATTALALTFFV